MFLLINISQVLLGLQLFKWIWYLGLCTRNRNPKMGGGDIYIYIYKDIRAISNWCKFLAENTWIFFLMPHNNYNFTWWKVVLCSQNFSIEVETRHGTESKNQIPAVKEKLHLGRHFIQPTNYMQKIWVRYFLPELSTWIWQTAFRHNIIL